MIEDQVMISYATADVPPPWARSAVATHIACWDPSSRVVPIAMGPQSSTEDRSCRSP